MLPKKFRLKIVEFNKNPQKAAKFISPIFILMLKAGEAGNPRFYISTPKFLDKRSSHRHRTKRIIIEAIRKKLASISPSVDVIIKTRKILSKKDRDIASKEVNRAFYEMRLLK